jgi:phospholipase/lecithinase/hemolysin
MLSTAFRILLLVATSYIAALPTQQHERQSPHYTRLVVFGDSYSDNGSGARVVSNNTWPADPAYYSHSFS